MRINIIGLGVAVAMLGVATSASASAPATDRTAVRTIETQIQTASILNGWTAICPAKIRVVSKFGFGGEISGYGTGYMPCFMIM